MSSLFRLWLAAAPFFILFGFSVVPLPPADDAAGTARASADPIALIDLLPESTLLAVEIRDLERRWPAIRGIPAIRQFHDRLLSGSALAPGDLPRLAGDRAVLALVAGNDGRPATALALLRPRRLDRAEAILRAVVTTGDGALLTTRRDRGALWIGRSEESARLEEIAAGNGTTFRPLLTERAARRSSPGDELVRGWLNPVALRAFVSDRVEGTEPLQVDLLRTFAAAALESVRSVEFRRDVNAEGIFTDAVVEFDPHLLPTEVAHMYRLPAHPAPVLPDPLPRGALFASAFRTHGEALLPWLRHVAARDARGPLRNLDFWIDEFERRYDRDLEYDIAASLGELGWIFALEGDQTDRLRALLIFETRDAARLEATLLDLRAWLVEQTRGRTLGLISPRARDRVLNSATVHDLSVCTLFAELQGPAFVVVDGHLLLGSGRAAIDAGLQLMQTRDSWAPAEIAVAKSDLTPHESLRMSGPALSRWIDRLIDFRFASEPKDPVTSALTGLIADLGGISIDVWYEEDTIRIAGQVRFE